MIWTTYCKVGDISCCSLLNQHEPYFTWVSNINKFLKKRASLKKYMPHNIKLKASQDNNENIFDMIHIIYEIHILHISSDVKICGSVRVPHIFSLNTRRQWAFSIILHSLYLQVQSPTNTLHRRIGVLHSWCVYSGTSSLSTRRYNVLQWSRTICR